MKKNLRPSFKVLFALILFLLAMNANSFAQNTTISGQIKTADGDPLVGAAVLVKGTSNGTVTDANGSFLFNNVAKGSFG